MYVEMKTEQGRVKFPTEITQTIHVFRLKEGKSVKAGEILLNANDYFNNDFDFFDETSKNKSIAIICEDAEENSFVQAIVFGEVDSSFVTLEGERVDSYQETIDMLRLRGFFLQKTI